MKEDLKTLEAPRPAFKPRLKRFWCDPCGTVFQNESYLDCQMCGSKTEELS